MRIKKEMGRLLPTQILRILKQKGGTKICGALEKEFAVVQSTRSFNGSALSLPH